MNYFKRKTLTDDPIKRSSSSYVLCNRNLQTSQTVVATCKVSRKHCPSPILTLIKGYAVPFSNLVLPTSP